MLIQSDTCITNGVEPLRAPYEYSNLPVRGREVSLPRSCYPFGVWVPYFLGLLRVVLGSWEDGNPSGP